MCCGVYKIYAYVSEIYDGNSLKARRREMEVY